MPIVLVGHLLKTEKGYKNLKNQKIKDILIETNLTKLAFTMIWLMVSLKIYLEEKY